VRVEAAAGHAGGGERGLERAAEPPPDLGKVLDGGQGPGDPLVVEGAGLEPVVRRAQLVRRERVEHLAPAVQHAHVRPEELVHGTGEEVGLHGPDVDREVGRGVDGVHVGQRPRLVGAAHELDHRVDRAHSVGRPAERDELRPPVERGVERLDVQGDVLGADVHDPHRDPPVRRSAAPRADVRLVIEARDHDLVARLHRRGDRPGNVHGERGHVGAELDLGRIGRVEEVRQRRVGVLEHGVAPPRRQEGALVVRVGLAVVAHDGVDHGVRDLGAARAVEQGHGSSVLLDGEGGKAGAQRLDIELGHGSPHDSGRIDAIAGGTGRAPVQRAGLRWVVTSCPAGSRAGRRPRAPIVALSINRQME
jgi:hypothetical protein